MGARRGGADERGERPASRPRHLFRARGGYLRWTQDEEEALVAGVRAHGPGRWFAILSDPAHARRLQHRTNVDLKDKWRTKTFACRRVEAELAPPSRRSRSLRRERSPPAAPPPVAPRRGRRVRDGGNGVGLLASDQPPPAPALGPVPPCAVDDDFSLERLWRCDVTDAIDAAA